MNEKADQNFSREQEFRDLRTKVHEEMRQALMARLEQRPTPTQEELEVGAYAEEMEPQVRDAVFEFYRKGYATESSGFWGEHADQQSIIGKFSISDENKKRLAELGTSVTHPTHKINPDIIITSISFTPAQADMAEIKRKWDEIAASLSDTGKPARNSSILAIDIRYRFKREEGEKELKDLEELYSQGDYPEEIKTRMLNYVRQVKEGTFKRVI